MSMQELTPFEINRVRQTVLEELRAAERDLTQRLGEEPERVRESDLHIVREAILSLVRLMPDAIASTQHPSK